MMLRAGIGLKTTYDELLIFSENGPIKNTLRFSDECARHKVLDIVGDLALTGIDIHTDIVAFRSGHRLNTQLAKRLHETYQLGSAEAA